MKAVPMLLFGLLLLAAAPGCAPSAEQKLIGNWQGKIVVKEPEATPSESQNPAEAAIAAAMKAGMQNMVASLTAEYSFRADKTLDISVQTPFGAQSMRGTWEVVSDEGNLATVRIHPENRAMMEHEIVFSDKDHFQVEAEHGAMEFTRKVESGGS